MFRSRENLLRLICFSGTRRVPKTPPSLTDNFLILLVAGRKAAKTALLSHLPPKADGPLSTTLRRSRSAKRTLKAAFPLSPIVGHGAGVGPAPIFCIGIDYFEGELSGANPTLDLKRIAVPVALVLPQLTAETCESPYLAFTTASAFSFSARSHSSS